MSAQFDFYTFESGHPQYPDSFLVTLARVGDLDQPIEVDWQVTGGSASAADFLGGVFPSGTVRFRAGEDSTDITITIISDGIPESDESFNLVLQPQAPYAVAGPDAGISGVIRASDGFSELTASNGNTLVDLGLELIDREYDYEVMWWIRFSRNGDATTQASFDWVLSGDDLPEYLFKDSVIPSGSVTFEPGEWVKQGEFFFSPNETADLHRAISIEFSNVRGVAIADEQFRLMLVDDDSIADQLDEPVPRYLEAPDFLFNAGHYAGQALALGAAFDIEDSLAYFRSNPTIDGRWISPTPFFDAGYYMQQWADLTGLNLDAATLYAHYNLFGVWEGRWACAALESFNGDDYLERYLDVAGYVDVNVDDFLGSRSNGAIAHYVIYGEHEQRTAYDADYKPIELDYFFT